MQEKNRRNSHSVINQDLDGCDKTSEQKTVDWNIQVITCEIKRRAISWAWVWEKANKWA